MQRAAAVLITFVTVAGFARADHPRLLCTADDLPRIQHAVGIGPRDIPIATGPYGAYSDDLLWLRAYFSSEIDSLALPGELLACAFLVLVNPADANRERWIELVREAIADVHSPAFSPVQRVIALDWCWNAFTPQVREELALNLRREMRPFKASDSPLQAREFASRLATLALVAGWQDEAEGVSWRQETQRIKAAAETGFEVLFPVFAGWRGAAPTTPSAAGQEEADAALAVEFASLALGRDLWPAYRGSVGRWLEHYLLTESGRTGPFLRDDWTLAAATPAGDWTGLAPLTAFLIALRAEDPAAAEWCARMAPALRRPDPQSPAPMWRWLPAMFPTGRLSRASLERLPSARNLGSAVVLRGEGDCVVWIDAAQPFLRREQHFDAGNFLIHCNGRVTPECGIPVASEATAAKGGMQGLGSEREPFEFDQFTVSSIAHNVMLFVDPARVQPWRGRPMRIVGGQTPHDETCESFNGPLEGAPASTGRLLAYGADGDRTAYVALDLARAYDPRCVTTYTREFVFLGGRMLLIVDRALLAAPRVTPVWLLQLPARPSLDGEDLARAEQVAGSSPTAGVWRVRADWITWNEPQARGWRKCVWPPEREQWISGGPSTEQLIAGGPAAGKGYIGGEANGFERLIHMASEGRNLNAWFRLGKPTLISPWLSAARQWGRVETRLTSREEEILMIHAIVVDAAGSARPTPEVEAASVDGAIEVRARVEGLSVSVRLPAKGLGGDARFERPAAGAWRFPADVQADPALPTTVWAGGAGD